MNYKKIKLDAKKNVTHNYFKNVIVVFLCTLLISGISLSSKNIFDIDITDVKNIELINSNYKSNSEIIDEFIKQINDSKDLDENLAKRVTHGVVSVVVNEITTTKSVVFSLLNSINKFLGGHISVGIVIIISNILLIFMRTIFIAVFEIGKNRYFLEQRRYLKTNIDRTLYPYKKKKTFHLALILFVKNLYLFLWSFTIIGYFIKYYEYAMIPYILAENPNIKMREAFRLSKELMKQEKFNLFKLDLLLAIYKIPGLFTFNLTNYFFTDIYAATLYSEFYMNLRNYKREDLTNKNLLNDKLLAIDYPVNKEYPNEFTKQFSILNINSDMEYSLNTYILLFFSFSIFGWLWEVVLHIIQQGDFVNRGTMHGPWLPIYGYGGVAILFLLKRFRKNPSKLFIATVILCGIIEYSTAWYLETFKHLKYWDYSGYFLNLHGRICFEGLIIFGLGGCAFTYILAPLLSNLFDKIRLHTKNIIALILITLFSIDFFYSTFVSPNVGEGITTEVEEVSDYGH
ncbi:MAG: hypothetical protein IJ068_01680 [Bacilli bacterium]|nr:hypothetical protein [Bacilli bacterium]